MSESFDLTRSVVPVAPVTITQRHKARLTTARYARDTDDLRRLLDVLGLWPAADHQPAAKQPPALFVGPPPPRDH